MKRMMNKRGYAHFEMIVAFVFFGGFVFSLFLVLKPYETETLSDATIRGFYHSFENEVSTNLSTFFLKAGFFSGACFVADLPMELFNYEVKDGNSYTTKLTGEEVYSYIDNVVLNVGNSGQYFKVGISPEFYHDTSSQFCDPTIDYTIGFVGERKVISYKLLTEMKDRYYSDYEGLKEELRIPFIYDYAIDNKNLPDVLMVPERGVLDYSDVNSETYYLPVLKGDGTLTNERFILKIW